MVLMTYQWRILRFSLGLKKMRRIKYEHIRGPARFRDLGDKVKEVGLRRFGQKGGVREYIGRIMVKMDGANRRERLRPKRRFLALVKVQLVGKMEKESCCGKRVFVRIT